MYTALSFKGYKSFPDGITTTLEMIKHCNIIIGKNNSGKSSLLDVIGASCDEHYFQRMHKKMNDLEAVFLMNGEYLGGVFKSYSSINGVYNPHSEALQSVGQEYRVLMEQSGAHARYSMTQHGNDHFCRSALSGYWGRIAENIARSNSTWAFRRISAERNIVPENEDNDETLSENGTGASNLIRKIVNYSGYDETLVEKTLLNALNAIMHPEIEFEEIKVQQIDDGGKLLWEVFLREKGCGRYALSQSGSGLKTIVLVLLNLMVIPHTSNYAKKTIIYGFEELENNLHPALQRKLFDYIYEFAVKNDVYVFLTTHSHIAINAFFGRDEATIYHVTKDIDGSKVKRIDNYLDKVEILDDLDVKASDLLQSNGIIWVEGPSDRVYVKRWLQVFCDCQYVEGRDYQFMYYGGRLLSHYSTEQATDLLSILTTNRNAAIIIDSDKRNQQTKLNNTKKRIVSEFCQHGMFAWVTKGKEIENYIPAVAVAATFNLTALAECGQYELFSEYIEKVYSSFSSRKVAFANKVIKNISAENSDGKLDLVTQIHKLHLEIKKWNGG